MAAGPSEQSEAYRLKRRFKKKSECTNVFDDWDESIQSFLQNSAGLEDGELPILAFYQSETHWFLVTSRRLLWINPDQLSYELRHDDVQAVGWSSGPEGWPGRAPADRPDTMVITSNGKGHCSHFSPWLHIVDYSGKRYEAFLEQGNLTGIRNTIWQLSAGWFNAFEHAREENESGARILPPTGSDAYRARKLRINVEKYREAQISVLQSAVNFDGRTEKSIREDLENKQLVKLYEEINEPTIQNFFREHVELQDSEIPILAYRHKSNSFLVITSRCLLWSINSERHALGFWEIESSGLSYGPAGAAIDWANPAEILRKSPYGKAVWLTKVADICSPWIYVESFRGCRYEIYLEPGQDKFMILDCLKLMIRLEELHPRGGKGTKPGASATF